MTLEIELGITGEEDGVDNSDVDSSKLYTQPDEVAFAYEELSKVSPRFTIAAAFETYTIQTRKCKTNSKKS
jgi:fructose-bisphosphate aldolase class II